MKDRFEHTDSVVDVTLRAERFNDEEVTIATCSKGVWQQLYISSELARELAHFLISRANEIEAEKPTGLIADEIEPND